MAFKVDFIKSDGSWSEYDDEASFEVLPGGVLVIINGGARTHWAPHTWRCIRDDGPPPSTMFSL